jgi:alanine transaminase
MIPIPQYPLYSASITLCGGSQVGYYLEEATNWSLNITELSAQLAKARNEGRNIRALCVINPGNPVGNVLTYDNMKQVVEFAAKEKLILLADEVYQENVWAEHLKFISFKKVACDLGLVDPLSSRVNKGLQLASFHSISKGFTGECGRRGGYLELCGFDQAIHAEIYKLASISLCSNISGQVGIALQCKPPIEGDPSYPLYRKERDDILSSLRRRAMKLAETLNKLEGVSCQLPQGALYVFPTITLPTRAMEDAKKIGKAPDTMYCLQLLDRTGIVLVPGSGFHQYPNTFHFRSTILPPEHDMERVESSLSQFHKEFMDKYR